MKMVRLLSRNAPYAIYCVCVHPKLDQFWLIDYRIYDPTGNGKSKLDHVQEMLSHTVDHKQLPFQVVLMDTWYATKDLMLFIESLQKVYYCPLKDNRQVDDSGAERGYQRVDVLDWSEQELKDCASEECGFGRVEATSTPSTRDGMSALRSS